MEYLYLFVGVLLVAGVGGLIGAIPGKQDRWLARVRSIARQRGLVVDSVNLPLLGLSAENRVSAGGKARNLKRLCVRYQKFYPRSTKNTPQWKLLRDPDSTIPIKGWRAEGTASVGVNLFEIDYWRKIEKIVGDPPELCWGVQALSSACAWVGVERLDDRIPEDKVLEIDRFLDLLIANHLAWESNASQRVNNGWSRKSGNREDI